MAINNFNSISECISIKDIRANSKNINVIFIVLENNGPITITKENREVRTFKVGDPTACINFSIWDEPGKLLIPGDIVRLTKGYAAIWRSCLTLYSGKNGDIHKIGDFCLTFNEQLNMSEPNPMLMNMNPTVNPPLITNNGTVNNGTNSNNNNNNNGNNSNANSRQPIQGPQTTNTTNSSTSSTNKPGVTIEKEKRSNRNSQAKSNVKTERR